MNEDQVGLCDGGTKAPTPEATLEPTECTADYSNCYSGSSVCCSDDMDCYQRDATYWQCRPSCKDDDGWACNDPTPTAAPTTCVDNYGNCNNNNFCCPGDDDHGGDDGTRRRGTTASRFLSESRLEVTNHRSCRPS